MMHPLCSNDEECPIGVPETAPPTSNQPTVIPNAFYLTMQYYGSPIKLGNRFVNCHSNTMVFNVCTCTQSLVSQGVS